MPKKKQEVKNTEEEILNEEVKDEEIEEASRKSHYIDNAEFYRLLQEYAAQKKEPKVISEELATMFVKLATGVAYMNSFINYSNDWKNEMISDALYFCTKYVDRFDAKKWTNPHAYFTTTCIRAFKMRIKKEKAQNYKESRFRKEVFEEYFSSEGLYKRKGNPEVEDEANYLFTEFDHLDDSMPEIDMSMFVDEDSEEAKEKKLAEQIDKERPKTIDDFVE